MKNAIILAAGKSNKFAPFTYEKPKGLFIVRNEVLIERQIEQLIEAGIKDIYIIVGYMKEKFFYLEQKYPQVSLIVNNTFGRYGNLSSLFSARQYLSDTFICCADHYFLENPFLDGNDNNVSYRTCAYLEGNFREFSVDYSNSDIITGCYIGGRDKMAMIGPAYFNKSFSEEFRKLMEDEINNFGVANMYWEEFYAAHIRDLTLTLKQVDPSKLLEFDDIDDLRQFDSDFLLNVDSEIITNICDTLDAHPNEIKDIEIVQAGLTNVSFKFSIKDTPYIYRHPGGTADNLIDRTSELYVQRMAKEIGIDESVIYMDESGWKLSYYVQGIVECDFIKNSDQLEKAMEYIHKTHEIPITEDVKVFDDVAEGKKLMKIASATKGNLFREFEDIIEKVNVLDGLVKAEQEKYGIEPVISHNDVYEPNYIANEDKQLYLIDWEYAGINDPLNDIACIIARYDYTEEIREMFLEAYFGRELTEAEHRHARAQAVLCAFYWFCWGLYKGSVGDDDGFFFMPSYRYLSTHIDEALESYEVAK